MWHVIHIPTSLCLDLGLGGGGFFFGGGGFWLRFRCYRPPFSHSVAYCLMVFLAFHFPPLLVWCVFRELVQMESGQRKLWTVMDTLTLSSKWSGPSHPPTDPSLPCAMPVGTVNLCHRTTKSQSLVKQRCEHLPLIMDTRWHATVVLPHISRQLDSREGARRCVSILSTLF